MAWPPSAPIERVRLRASLLREIRHFFEARNVLEVETPILSRAGTVDPNIESFVTQSFWLHTSPEFAMKRLLAAGYGSIYQVAHVFRDGESGRYHNPEFTLLEWYRTGFDYHALMDEVEALLGGLLPDPAANSFVRLTYRDAFIAHTGLDPFACSDADCDRVLFEYGMDVSESNKSGKLDLLMSQVVQPAIASLGAVFIYDYPADQASLARLSSTNSAVAERFELFVNGVELGNGFSELTDADEQEQRFTSENEQRQSSGQQTAPIDQHLISALNAGLPDCAGVAIGLDRLLMVMSGADHIDDVLCFPIERA